MMRARVGVLIASLMMIVGCQQDISEVRIEMDPDQGCAPLRVSLVGAATVRDGADVGYRWNVNGEVLTNSNRVQYAFRRPGAYDIVFTVTSEQEERSETAVLNVREATLPNEPGVYRRLDCGYQALAVGSEQTQTVSLGKTSLEDLEKIMGRKLSTPELVLHPLWRREHTHTTHTIERSQFGEMALDHFQQLGFITVGKALGEAALFKIAPAPEPKPPAQIVSRMIDSWGKESVEPQTQALERTELTPEIAHYLPRDALTAGFYFISVQPGEDAPPVIRPIALVPVDR
ncbi:PKD domain-containing protein [Candidatus Entotheonella palauensis]|nr:PKD domain-containing protein [Candidatus Entotheonella palauensis]